ncbi:MAG: hypothetical protein J6Y29_04295 [Clostridiales bacterium]|nr:hypothetical protein [Clostridiales bacterium]
MPDLNMQLKKISKKIFNDERSVTINIISRLNESRDILSKLRSEGITKPSEIVKFLKDMITLDKGSFVAKNIETFCVMNQNDLIDLCYKLIDYNYGQILIDNFEKFNIREERKRVDIAIELIDKGMGYNLIDNIEKFEIQVEKNKVLLIKEIISFTGSRLTPYMVKNLHRFNLRHFSSRYGLANKLIDMNCGDVLIDNIVKFGINREKELLVLIDKLIKLNYGYGLIDSIEDFNLDLGKNGFNLAKRLVRNNGYKLIYNIKKFKIEKEEDRLYIAKQLIKGYMYTFIENIELFSISNKCELLEEFAIKDKKDVCLLRTGLDRYENNIKNMERIFNVILFKDKFDLDMLNNISLYRNSLEIVAKTFLKEEEVFLYQKNLDNIKKLRNYCEEKKINFDLCEILGKNNSLKIEKTISLIKEKRREDDANEIVEKILFAFVNTKIGKENKDELTELIIELISIKDARLKKELLPIVAKFMNNDKLYKIHDEVLRNRKKKAFPAINAIIFYRLALYEKKNINMLFKLRNAFDNSNFLRNSMDVQETFRKMIKLESLQIEFDKVIDILDFLSKKPKNMCKNLGYILDIITLKGEEFIDVITDNFEEGQLRLLFYQVYSEHLKLDKDENFIKNYENFVNKSENVKRNLGEYILKYVADNNCDKEVMKEVRKFISTMHDIKEFRKYKYDIRSDGQLRAIKRIDEEVYLKWTSRQDEFEHKQENMRAQITDNPVDLFLIGTEIDGSCQSIKGRRELNKCLVGIIGEGRNKAVVIKENDRIIARCIIRILIDKNTDEIVLLREKMYKVNGLESRTITELNKKCIEYAKWLKVSLVCEDENVSDTHTMTLASMGGHAKYEYVDFAKKLFDTIGTYIVTNDKLVYLYKE